MFKESAIANLIFSLAPIAIGLLMAILLPGAMRNPGRYAGAALAFYGIGFVFFAAAKIQNIRKGHLLSFGFVEDVDAMEMGISNWLRSNGARTVLNNGVAGHREVQPMRGNGVRHK